MVQNLGFGGWDNLWQGFNKGTQNNSNALIASGAALMGGQGLGGAGMAWMQGQGLDQDRRKLAAEQEERNATAEWLKANYPQYAGLPPAEGFKAALAEMGRTPDTIDPTTAMQEYDYARTQGYGGTFEQWKTDVARAGATNISMNNEQANAATYADRMANANTILSDPKVEGAMLDMVQQGVSSVPVFGNMLTSEERKMAEQAQRDFINAVLRKESGAVISPSEFENASKQYFPQPGDTPAVLEQKRRNREVAIEGIKRAAGPNYQQPNLTPPGVVPFTDFFN